jgi:membrane associated rhomboid family serine protease
VQDAYVPTRRFQRFEVVALVIVNVAVFAHQRSLNALQHANFDFRYGAVPALILDGWQRFMDVGPRLNVLPAFLPVITANYLHVDVGHLVGNMLFLWIFASVLSEVVGRTPLLVLYTLGGMVAVIAYVLANPTSEFPMFGASGAVAGLEGAYFTLVLRWNLPDARLWPSEATIPPWSLAVVALANLALDTGAIIRHSREHTAFEAHFGGFFGGTLVAMVIATVGHRRQIGI